MTDAARLNWLQKIAEFRTTCSLLRRAGKVSIGCGCCYLFLGAMAFQGQFLDYCYLTLGAIEVLVGLKNRYSPSAPGLILDGFLAILLGSWLVAQQIFILIQGGNVWCFGLVMGLVVLLFGSQSFFRKYRQVRSAFREPPTEEQIAWFDGVVAEIQAADVTETADMVEFQVLGSAWKGKRIGDVLIFVDKLDIENLIVDRHDVLFIDEGKTASGNVRIARLRIGQRTLRYTEFKPEMLARLEAWRTDDMALAGEPVETK